MFATHEASNLMIGEEICLFKKDGLLPITCGKLEYIDDECDEVYININKHSVKLTKHLYDFVSTTVSMDLELKNSFEQARQQYMQFCGMIKRESKT